MKSSSPGWSSRWVLSGVAVAVSLVALGFGYRLVLVHDQYWEWSLSPSAAPPKIQVEGRDYRRGSADPSLGPGLVRITLTARDEPVYGPVDRTYAPTGVVLLTPEGPIDYSLMGGP